VRFCLVIAASRCACSRRVRRACSPCRYSGDVPTVMLPVLPVLRHLTLSAAARDHVRCFQLIKCLHILFSAAFSTFSLHIPACPAHRCCASLPIFYDSADASPYVRRGVRCCVLHLFLNAIACRAARTGRRGVGVTQAVCAAVLLWVAPAGIAVNVSYGWC